MTTGYAIIPVLALICYSFLMLAFLATKRTHLLNCFLLVLLSLILWNSGSLLMRLQFWPSVGFWYHVSLMGVSAFPCTLLAFLRSFLDEKVKKLDLILVFLCLFTVILNVFTGFLPPPSPTLVNGELLFVYSFTPFSLLVYLFPAILVTRITVQMAIYCRNAVQRRQVMFIVIGMLCLMLGNLLIMVPIFESVPIDMLSGLVNVLLLFYALYRRQIFRMKLLVSRRTCYCLGLVTSFLLLVNLIEPLEKILRYTMGASAKGTPLIIAVVFSICTYVLCYLFNCILDAIFVKDEELRSETVQHFSASVSKTLSESEIISELFSLIQTTIGARKVYFVSFDEKAGLWNLTHSSSPLDASGLKLADDNPLIKWLSEKDSCLLLNDFIHTINYRSMWESEKDQLQRLHSDCVAPLKADGSLIGILFLSVKNGKKAYSPEDLAFVSSVCSVASIACKNARMYEKVYQEARTDELTGLLNRKYFYQILNETYESAPNRALSLMILNVDDFKLYNQLYGVQEGDKALQNISRILSASVGDKGYVARYSGKEFAILLPEYDVLATRTLGDNLRRQIMDMNRRASDYAMKALTISGGICSLPYGASNPKQLVENADMTVFEAKRSGKNTIMIYSVGHRFGGDGPDEPSPEQRQHIYADYASTIYALTAAIDTKDHYTFTHSNNVASYAASLAYAAGLNDDSVEIIREAALLHDIGKIGIPESILQKPGKLTGDEYEVMKGHVENSIGIIRHLPSLDYVIPAVIGHHEHYDGRGYPRRLAGEDIPLSARILCIADSFDAIISRRSYKEPIPTETALDILQREAGHQFDPKLAPLFIQLVRSGKITVVQQENS